MLLAPEQKQQRWKSMVQQQQSRDDRMVSRTQANEIPGMILPGPPVMHYVRRQTAHAATPAIPGEDFFSESRKIELGPIIAVVAGATQTTGAQTSRATPETEHPPLSNGGPGPLLALPPADKVKPAAYRFPCPAGGKRLIVQHRLAASTGRPERSAAVVNACSMPESDGWRR
jgi:hypothetical protein